MELEAEEQVQAQFVEAALLALSAECEIGKTFSPMDAAKRACVLDGRAEAAWPSRLSEVRRAAVRLAQEKRLVIYRKRKAVDPQAFKGVYRLGP
ncbi:MAG TPA: DUF3253 domain-containing protein [Beijerinckiaceae bacterium]|nr:DUF3253 domain-containing protein [Beijerinckiaceae bacterium]HVB89150.1 DUF3253 domain-containing protein [Beijerinckiaceae bacterium]